MQCCNCHYKVSFYFLEWRPIGRMLSDLEPKPQLWYVISVLERSEQCCPSGSDVTALQTSKRIASSHYLWATYRDFGGGVDPSIVRCARISPRSNPLFGFSQELDRKSELVLLIIAIVEQLLMLECVTIY